MTDNIVLEKRIKKLSDDLEKYVSQKRRLENENNDLSDGYDKISKAKNEIINKTDEFVRNMKTKANLFPSTLSCINSFCNGIFELNGEVQKSISFLQDAMSKINKDISCNENEIELLRKKIRIINDEISELRLEMLNGR